MLFDTAFVGPRPEDALAFAIEILESSTEYSLIGKDLNGKILLWNEGARQLYGYEGQEVIGRATSEILHPPEDIAAGFPGAMMEEALRRGKWEGVLTRVRKNGERFLAQAALTPRFNAAGERTGYLLVSKDISDVMALEEQVRRAQQRLRDVVLSSPAVLFTLMIEEEEIQRISWISDNLREVLGYQPEVAVGLGWWPAHVHPDDMESAIVQTQADLFTRGSSTGEYRFLHGDGSYRWTRCHIRLMRDEAGRPTEAVGAWTDVTERKQAEEGQAMLREQLQQVQKLESIGRLAGGVAHDFNNLLTVINGYSDQLLRQLVHGDPMQESVAEIREAGQRAAELVRQLMLFSQKEVTEAGEVNLNDIVTEVGKMLARVIGEDIRLEFALAASLGCIRADPELLRQVVMNLAVNARDAMPGGGTLLIETRDVDLDESYAQQHANVKPGQYVQLKVSDTGIGMTDTVMSHIFEPFFSTKEPGKGTGLGLATVYGIVRQSGGSIRVYSEPNAGTTFTIYLPRIDPCVGTRQSAEPAPDILRGMETILIVEDQDQLRRMAGRILRSYGYRVLEAANPGEALLHSERYAGPIHLMLTDVVMPGMTGSELADRLRPLRPAMELIFMSGYSQDVVKDRLGSMGAYLQKPFSPEVLAGSVRRVLGSPHSAGTTLWKPPKKPRNRPKPRRAT
jgi:PAS domain S-box-containing protein